MANVDTNTLCKERADLILKKTHSDSTKKFSETDVINMLEFLIDNIFVILGGRVFQQTVGIPMGTNCAPLLEAKYNRYLRQVAGFLKAIQILPTVKLMVI
jgi:hypothetical protein